MAAKDKTEQSAPDQTGEDRSAVKPATKNEIPHDPGHGRWILDPITGERRNNHEE